MSIAADPIIAYMDKPALEKAILKTEKDMHRAAKNMEFMDAARLRDELEVLRNKVKEMAYCLHLYSDLCSSYITDAEETAYWGWISRVFNFKAEWVARIGERYRIETIVWNIYWGCCK